MNPRERRLLLAMGGLFAFMGLFTLFNWFSGTLDELETDIAAYEEALSLISHNQTDFREQLAETETLNERLRANTLHQQLPSFLEERCVQARVELPSDYREERTPMRDTTPAGRVVEYKTHARIQAAEPTNLNRLLHSIANSDEIVIIKSILIQPARTRTNAYQVDLTLSTFRLEQDEDEDS